MKLTDNMSEILNLEEPIFRLGKKLGFIARIIGAVTFVAGASIAGKALEVKEIIAGGAVMGFAAAVFFSPKAAANIWRNLWPNPTP